MPTIIDENTTNAAHLVNLDGGNNNNDDNNNSQINIRLMNIENNVANLTKEVDIIKLDVNNMKLDITDIKLDVALVKKDISIMQKAINGLQTSQRWVIGLMVAIAFGFLTFTNGQLNNFQRILENNTKQIEDKINAQNLIFDAKFQTFDAKFLTLDAKFQTFDAKFSSLMKENDRAYQLALEALKRVSEPVPSRPELSTNPSPPRIGSPPEANQLAPGGEIR